MSRLSRQVQWICCHALVRSGGCPIEFEETTAVIERDPFDTCCVDRLLILRQPSRNSAGILSASRLRRCFLMQIEYASLSIAGPVRPHNEDSVGYWEPDAAGDWRGRGAVVVLADGVGGQDRGEVASRLACEAAVKAFTEAKPNTPPNQVLWQMFTAANLSVYDTNLHDRQGGGKMATTLTASVFRNNEVTVGHVGDCRVYVVQQGRIRRVTNDHSYAGVQLKLGLITVQDAMSSQLRSVLTRSVGQEPTIHVDFHTITVNAGDTLVQMCDGVWAMLAEGKSRTSSTSCRRPMPAGNWYDSPRSVAPMTTFQCRSPK